MNCLALETRSLSLEHAELDAAGGTDYDGGDRKNKHANKVKGSLEVTRKHKLECKEKGE